MNLELKTRTNVCVEVWTSKRDASGNLVRDRLKSTKRFHNTTGTSMLNYKTYYMAYEVVTKPVNYIKFFWNSSASSAYAQTSFTNASYATTWTASWTNTTGSSQTVNAIKLVNMSDASTDINFCTAAPAQVVADDEIMAVSWTHTHTTSGSPAVGNAILTNLRDCLTGDATTSDPLYSCTFTADGAYGSHIVTLGAPYSNGSLSDTTAVWKPVGTSPTGATTLAAFYVYTKAGDAAYSSTGLSTSWPATYTLQATITVTLT